MRFKTVTGRLVAVSLALDLPFGLLAMFALSRLLDATGRSALVLYGISGTIFAVRTALYAAVIVAVMRPIEEWLRDQGTVAGAHNAAGSGPLTLGVVASFLWSLTFGASAMLYRAVEPAHGSLGQHDFVGIALFVMAVLLGTFAAGYVVVSWNVAPVMARISLATPVERCSLLSGSDPPLRARLVVLFIAAALGPSAWIASFAYLSGVRSTLRIGEEQAAHVAYDMVSELRSAREAPDTVIERHSRPGVAPFIATAEGEVLFGKRAHQQTDPDKMVAVAQLSGPNDWIVGAAVSLAGEAGDSFARTFGVFTFILIIWAPVLALFLSGTISNQVANVARVVEEVAERESARGASRAPLYDHEELGMLARGVNRMLERLEKAEIEAAHIEQFKDEFIRVTAHELKTPVAIIKGYANLLARSGDGKNNRAVQAIERGVSRMDHIVSDLVDICEIRVGRGVLRSELVDLRRVADEVAQRASSQTGRRIVLESSRCPAVRGDPARIAGVLSVLLDNALKYSPVESEVNVKVHAENGDAVLTVMDHGIGIPESMQEKIFEPFRRAHTDTPFDHGGLGIGLYLSRLLVERHRGRIWFESHEGRGSTFHVAFPTAVESGHEQEANDDGADHRG